MELSQDLVDHQRFLLTFTPSGDVDHDVAAFLVGVGQPQILERYRQLNLPLRGLAVQICDRHRDELARIKRGHGPSHDAKYYRRSPEALELYTQLLELEEEVLATILKQDEHSKAA